ncbi:PilZ domain-containing protein [Marinobacter koreensis]|uniref:PilZ domain-containing protein n=2 Tax=Bacteria TaxID=2 RepID=A0ABW0RKL6_9GAMM|nr:PilZ domain-containing protein [Marinobacter koreensis]MCK7547364.1 PilZ domain-containing protein [Marinobacter koreensis]MDX1817574.1 PilZ domain-containing protein [Marinobacter sp.]
MNSKVRVEAFSENLSKVPEGTVIPESDHGLVRYRYFALGMLGATVRNEDGGDALCQGEVLDFDRDGAALVIPDSAVGVDDRIRVCVEPLDESGEGKTIDSLNAVLARVCYVTSLEKAFRVGIEFLYPRQPESAWSLLGKARAIETLLADMESGLIARRGAPENYATGGRIRFD